MNLPSSGLSVKRRRDVRLDFARGLALVFMYIDHIPANPLERLTLQGWFVSDAAEVFVFVAGYAAGLAYGGRLVHNGMKAAVEQIWRRSAQIYLVHLALFAICAGLLALAAAYLGKPLLAEWLSSPDYPAHPGALLLRILLLECQPGYLGILPLYVFVLLLFPLALWAMRRNVLLALLPSFLLYALTQATGLNLPASTPTGGWSFDPFAWQFLFVVGSCASYARVSAAWSLPGRGRIHRRLLILATAIVAAAIVLKLLLSSHVIGTNGGFFHYLFAATNKQLLAPPRLVSILGLVLLGALLVPRDPPVLATQSATVLGSLGQNSLKVFGLTVVLIVLGIIFTRAVGTAWWTIAVLNIGGILAILGFSLCLAQAVPARRLATRAAPSAPPPSPRPI